MTAVTDAELDRRGCATLLASWEEYARGCTGASLRHLPGVVAAVFPHEPERAFYNNALLSRGLSGGARARAVDAMATAYADAGVYRYAAWVAEDDQAMRAELERREYTVDTTTLAMGLDLDTVAPVRAEFEVGPATWSAYLGYEGLPTDFLAGADHATLRVLAIRDGDEIVAAALGYHCDGDCGIFNVGTAERARRRGLGTAVTLAQLKAARDRGCRTASLQSTPMAERLYRRLGFRDLVRFLEYVP